MVAYSSTWVTVNLETAVNPTFSKIDTTGL